MKAPDGNAVVEPGSWVVEDAGKIRVVSNEVFTKTYEPCQGM